MKNAKNAILEELPRIVNTMALLWNVLRKEETHKRPVDLLGATKGSSSVYFKTTKVRELPLWFYYFFRRVLSHQNKHVWEYMYNMIALVLLCPNSSLSPILDHTTKNFRLLEPVDGPSWGSVDSCSRDSVEQKEAETS